MWAKLKRFFKDERGFVALEYLIMIIIVVAMAVAVVAALKDNLVSTHNSAVNNITQITGSGY